MKPEEHRLLQIQAQHNLEILGTEERKKLFKSIPYSFQSQMKDNCIMRHVLLRGLMEIDDEDNLTTEMISTTKMILTTEMILTSLEALTFRLPWSRFSK